MPISPPKSTLPEISALSSEYNWRSLDLSDTHRVLLALHNSDTFEDQRRIVVSQGTSLVLKLNFTPSPGHPLAFDALEIPLTRSVKYAAGRKNPRILSLQILLVDALASIFVPPHGWDQDQVDEENSPLSLVDFKAEKDIIYLRAGKATVRFTLPCCLLDSIHRTGLYR
jgi:hypothetical protein